MFELLRSQSRGSLDRILRMWREKHKSRHAAAILGLALYVTTFMIVFDHLFVHDPKPFTIGRAIALLILFPAYMLNGKLPTAYNPLLRRRILSSSLLMMGPVLMHLQYIYYVFILEHEKTSVYFTGLMLIVFYASFVLHKFKAEQLAFNFSGLLTAVPLIFLKPDRMDLALILIVSHLVAGFIFTYFRRDFNANLLAVYGLLRIMMPAQVAEVLTMSYETADATEFFRPEERFTVCLTADWRGFQKLANTKTADEVSELLEIFYDTVLASLEKLVPSDRYYFNWTADELFIVFFSENHDDEDILRDGIEFAKVLRKDIFEEFRAVTKSDVNYDIGLAAGIGLLGLQGPRHMKKTTIIGEVAGRAKRYETEARRLRNEARIDVPPILVIDEVLYDFGRMHDLISEKDFKPLQATERDILGSKCFVWLGKEKTEAETKPSSSKPLKSKKSA